MYTTNKKVQEIIEKAIELGYPEESIHPDSLEWVQKETETKKFDIEIKISSYWEVISYGQLRGSDPEVTIKVLENIIEWDFRDCKNVPDAELTIENYGFAPWITLNNLRGRFNDMENLVMPDIDLYRLNRESKKLAKEVLKTGLELCFPPLREERFLIIQGDTGTDLRSDLQGLIRKCNLEKSNIQSYDERFAKGEVSKLYPWDIFAVAMWMGINFFDALNAYDTLKNREDYFVSMKELLDALKESTEKTTDTTTTTDEVAEDAEYRERCKEGKFITQDDYVELVDYNHLMFDEFGEYLKDDGTDGDVDEEVTDNTKTDEELFTLEDGTVYTYDELKEKVKSPEFQYPDEWDIVSEVAKYCRDKKNHPESIPRADEMLDRYAVRGLAVYFDSSDTIAEALIKAYRLNHPTMRAPGKEAYEWMQNNVREYKKLSDDSKKMLQNLIYFQGSLSWDWHMGIKRIDAAKNAIELDETIIRLRDDDRATHHHTIKIYLNHLYESDYLSYDNLEFLEDAAVHNPEYFKSLYEYKCIPRMHTSILDDDLYKLQDKQDCYFDVKREFFFCKKNNKQHEVFSIDGCINTTLSELFDLDEVLHYLELQHVKFDDITYLKEMFSIPMRDIELDEDWFTYHDIWTCHNRYRLYNDDEFHKRDAETILLQGLMRGLPLEYIAYLIRDKGFKRGINIITDDAVEEVTDDNNKTDDVTVTNEIKEDNKMSTSKEVRINDAAFEQPARITETLIPMERFTLTSKEYTNLIVDVYISPDFERGCAVLLDDEAVNNADAWLKFDFETEGLNPEAFGSVENMIESLVDSNGLIPQGMIVRRHLKGAILPTRYGDIYSAMDDKSGALHTWIWKDDVMKSIDRVKLTVDYSNWQDAIEYILAENIADGLDLAAI